MDTSHERAVEAEVVKLWNAGADYEALLGYMRENRVSQIGSHLMLARVTGMDSLKAQKLVLHSRTWSDRFEVNVQLQKDLIQAIKESNEEDPNFKMSFEFEPDPEDSEDEPGEED